VWAITCLITRTPYRWQGLTYQMIAAAVEFARERGAHAVEGYGMLTEPGKEITWGELHVGSRNAFAASGFREVTRPTKRRVVMRIDLQASQPAARVRGRQKRASRLLSTKRSIAVMRPPSIVSTTRPHAWSRAAAGSRR
jgi:hypothetical protein